MATSRTGGSTGATIVGLKEFRLALRSLGPEWPKQLRRAHKTIADQGAARGRAFASGMGGVQAKYARAIKGRATTTRASIGVSAGKGNPGANVAFWGAKKRTGWYARSRYSGTPTPQHPEWVGNTWDVAEFGQGPYAINAALAVYRPELIGEFEKMVDRLSRHAFPEP